MVLLLLFGMKNNGYIFCPFRIFLNFNGDERERESRACEELPAQTVSSSSSFAKER